MRHTASIKRMKRIFINQQAVAGAFRAALHRK